MLGSSTRNHGSNSPSTPATRRIPIQLKSVTDSGIVPRNKKWKKQQAWKTHEIFAAFVGCLLLWWGFLYGLMQLFGEHRGGSPSNPAFKSDDSPGEVEAGDRKMGGASSEPITAFTQSTTSA
ncbi:unnamed protein product [Amoebophrya sp. A120]|nr:unnamed protein product [Amoebophrya sp. A120]|eukprot:GSA120T00010362001.1